MILKRVATQGLVSAALCVSLVIAALLGFQKAGSRAYAQEPAFVLFGSVASDGGLLPSRVRAVIGGVSCGSAEVVDTGNGTGFYALLVASADTKAACGVDGELVEMMLENGAIDPGSLGAATLFRSGAIEHLDLSAGSTEVIGSFIGELPVGAGEAFMRWSGPSGTPIATALRTVHREVVSASFWDVSRQEFRGYTPGAPDAAQTYTLVDADDVVLLRVK
jgi:hypothetical protein